ncbi:efflux RND transporter periplasmic adaptor subunit [Fastidiosibacter lacustris]|uniref:efflux RND transporter periplasmic adaptor subunit n=1 Tax=Fastidiosibacter lacustris TaxID=2056695 RepID=UPI000E348BE1|nr:efflux RND transporter periplasmic adaptor subunit [Fastidiosibacter lacustris]
MVEHVQQASKKKFITAFIIVIAILVVVFGGIFGFAAFVNGKKAAAMATWKMQPPEVTATQAKAQTWYPTVKTIGEAVAIQNVNVTAQASGLVSSISFEAGQMVKKGQVLFTLDTQQLQAQLKQAQADLELARITYERDLDLVKQQAISQQTADESKAKYEANLANVASIQANIGYHIVKAPFDGKIGLRQISLGQYFSAGNNAATLTEISPIYINFTVTQNYLSNLHVDGEIEFSSDTYPRKVFKAKITALNSEITSDNRAINVQATYDNKDQQYLIYPGMFLDVSVILPPIDNTIIIPRNAVSYALYGETVFVLVSDYKDGKPVIAEYSAFKDGQAQIISTGKQQYTAKQIPVKTTMTNNNEVIVEGIKANEIVATSGQNKLQNGSSAIINNDYNFKNNP